MFEVFWSPLPDFVADHTPCLAFSISRRYCMTQNTTTAKAHKATPVGTFNMRMGNTTYVIGVHFSKESKDTLEDKMKRLMRDDVKAANFWIENNLWLFRFLSWRNASEGDCFSGGGNVIRGNYAFISNTDICFHSGLCKGITLLCLISGMIILILQGDERRQHCIAWDKKL